MIELKTHKIADSLKIGDVNIDFEIDVAARCDEITKAQIEISKLSPKDMQSQEAGIAYINLIRAVFGDELAQKIIDFYANTNYLGMVLALQTFILEKVMPEVKEIRKNIVALKKATKKYE